jgi:hypothetical protein
MGLVVILTLTSIGLGGIGPSGIKVEYFTWLLLIGRPLNLSQ